MAIKLGEGLLVETLTQLRTCGAEQNECVAYWTGPRAPGDIVDEVLHPVHVSHPAFYEIDPKWLNATWADLAAAGRKIRVQVHTHGDQAFHSQTDDDFPIIQTAGFLSLVIPDFARGDDLSGAFLAELQSDGSWREVAIPERLVVVA